MLSSSQLLFKHSMDRKFPIDRDTHQPSSAKVDIIATIIIPQLTAVEHAQGTGNLLNSPGTAYGQQGQD